MGIPAPITTTAPAKPATERFLSLDAYRGLIMLTLLAGSIFKPVKDDPRWAWLAVQNDHVEWVGCVYWDLIQPSFMFMVGVAMPFAFARRTAAGDSWWKQFRHVLLRALNLILLGVLLDNIGRQVWDFGFIRVLQQIAIGYVFAFFVLGKSFRTQGLVAAAILIGYNLLWMFNRWNGEGGPWAMGNENIGSVFDRWMLRGRNYSGLYVGMNAIPATATIIFGVMAGQLIMSGRSKREIGLTLLIAGISGIVLGYAMSPWLPLIKKIWTPSFTVFAAGWTTLMLLAFYWVIEVWQWKGWAFPLVVVGMNSIAAYVMGSFRGWFKGFSNAWIEIVKEPLGKPGAEILQSFLFMCAAWGVLYWFYRRRIFFKL